MICVSRVYLRNIVKTILVILHFNVSRLNVALLVMFCSVGWGWGVHKTVHICIKQII